jgi:hypothetical protein
LLRAAADTAIEIGDRSAAAVDLAWMSIYLDRAPGIMADKPQPDDGATLRDQASSISDGSARAEAAIALATLTPTTAAAAYDGRNRDAAVLQQARRVVGLAHRAGDATLESAALDELCAVHLALDDIHEAAKVVQYRGEVNGRLAVVASNGFELLDCHLMASEVSLAAGDLVAAGHHADALARLPFFRDEAHFALRGRVIVDALAGNFDDVIRGAERFRVGWERAGRPPARGLARAAHAVAMVHGMLGADERRSEWLHITLELGIAPERLAGCAMGWAPTFDALLALHRDDPVAALRRLSADLDDPQVWGFWNTGLWRPWYAALWAEAAVLARHRDAAARIERSRHAARDNPIATAIVERAAAIAIGHHGTLERCAMTFAQLACPYQQARSGTLTAGLR